MTIWLSVTFLAAHCVTDSQGGVLPKENYLVGVGKLYRKYLAPEDTHAQYSEASYKDLYHSKLKLNKQSILNYNVNISINSTLKIISKN